jgi:DNA (cytosine-5)-methyltransferase 1
MKYLSLFSGIEAASVAWKPLGWECVGFSEIDKFACSILRYHYPTVRNYGDICSIKGNEFEHPDIIVGGSPCTGFSYAGKQEGLNNVQSKLAWEYLRVVGTVLPSWIVWENVPGVFSTSGGRDFGTFIKALVDFGYGICWSVLDAQWFRAPQRRRRVFLVGYLGDWRPSCSVLFDSESLQRNPPPSRKTREDVAPTLTKRAVDGGGGGTSIGGHCIVDPNVWVPDIVGQAMNSKWAKGSSGPAGDEYHNMIVPPVASTVSSLQRHDRGDGADNLIVSLTGNTIGRTPKNGGNGLGWDVDISYTLNCTDRHAVAYRSTVRYLTPLECERLQGFPDGYTDVPQGKAPKTKRYHVLGNSMHTAVMSWLGNRINNYKGEWDA